jgi:hexokinase
MDSIWSKSSAFIQNSIDYVRNDLIEHSARTSKKLTAQSLIRNGEHSLIGNHDSAFWKKMLGISVTGAIVMGSAFYVGYTLAKKRHRFHVSEADKTEQIEQILVKFKITKDSLNKVMSLMLEEMRKGLDPETHDTADVKMFPSYVRTLPDGTERGNILALDLGGTNFRVLLINLDSGEIKVKSKVFLIPQSIMIGTGTQLFDHIAKCLAGFMYAENLVVGNKEYPLGYTFSFPCIQKGLASAYLERWTKGFDCSGVIGKDVVQMLQDAINRRRDIQVKVLALVNDTVGTLMAAAYNDQNTRIGLILGTGSNACYVEDLDNVKTWTEDRDEPKQVISRFQLQNFVFKKKPFLINLI